MSKDLKAKFLSTRLGHSMLRIGDLNDAFSGILELEANLEESQTTAAKS